MADRVRSTRVELPRWNGDKEAYELVNAEIFEAPGSLVKVWPAGRLLSTFLRRNYKDSGGLRGKHVLEVGAGCGVASICAAMLGADVLCTDQETWLIDRNLSKHTEMLAAAEGSVKVLSLEWGVDATPPDDFDIVMASDVGYNAENWAILWELLDLVCSAETVLYIASERRQVNDEEFYEGAEEKGFVIELCDLAGLGRVRGGSLAASGWHPRDGVEDAGPLETWLDETGQWLPKFSLRRLQKVACP